jgi:transposase
MGLRVLTPDYTRRHQQEDACKFKTDDKGLTAMRHWLEAKVQFPDKHFLLEATGTYHFPVIRKLEGWVVTVINPILAGHAKRKTDRWDAKKLAHHDMVATFPQSVLPTLEEHELRTECNSPRLFRSGPKGKRCGIWSCKVATLVCITPQNCSPC